MTTPVTSPASCLVCGDKPYAALRAAHPTTEVAGHVVHLSCKHDLEHAIESIGRVIDPNAPVLRWTSNNQCPFDDMTGLWVRLNLVSAQQAHDTEQTRHAEAQEFFAAYRAAQANAQPSAEEMAEMRAAFGTGTTVVNVITGRRTAL